MDQQGPVIHFKLPQQGEPCWFIGGRGINTSRFSLCIQWRVASLPWSQKEASGLQYDMVLPHLRAPPFVPAFSGKENLVGSLVACHRHNTPHHTTTHDITLYHTTPNYTTPHQTCLAAVTAVAAAVRGPSAPGLLPAWRGHRLSTGQYKTLLQQSSTTAYSAF